MLKTTEKEKILKAARRGFFCIQENTNRTNNWLYTRNNKGQNAVKWHMQSAEWKKIKIQGGTYDDEIRVFWPRPPTETDFINYGGIKVPLWEPRNPRTTWSKNSKNRSVKEGRKNITTSPLPKTTLLTPKRNPFNLQLLPWENIVCIWLPQPRIMPKRTTSFLSHPER